MLKEQLMEDFNNAMKEKNEIRKNTIMMVRSAILQVEKDTQKELSENEIIEIISRELKKRKESVSDIEKSGRTDLLENINEEIAIIKAYLPEELSKEEIEKIIVETIAEVGATTMKEMGKVMQAVKPKVAGRADNKLVNEIVRAKLA